MSKVYNLTARKTYDFSQRYRDIFNGDIPGVERTIFYAFVPRQDNPEEMDIIYSPYAISSVGLMNEETEKLVTERIG